MLKKGLLLLLVGLVALCGYTYHAYYHEDQAALQVAQQTVQQGSGDAWLAGEHGLTRYRTMGEDRLGTVVLIHSFNGFLESWDPNVTALVAAGYRVVSYDLYGRGLSDRPWVNHDLVLFRGQLAALLTAVNATQVHLVGASFGSVIAADYALTHPTQVLSLSLLGPAGWPEPGAKSALLDVPGLAELVFHHLGVSLLRPKVLAYFIEPKRFSAMIKQWDDYAALPGFNRASLSILRHAPVFDYTDGWQQLGQLDLPVLFVWGQQDVSFPFHHTEKIPAFIPQAELVAVEHAAHWVNIEQAEVVNAALLTFLRSSTN